MISVPLVCYHGSPGMPEEFKVFSKYLHSLSRIPVISVTRRGYPESVPGPTQDSPGLANGSGRVLLGYSWGAVEAMRDATRSAEVRAVILVAPYLKPKNRLGFMKKTLLQTPWLGDALLRKASKKIIDDLFEKSCHPRAVPAEFWGMAETMSSPDVLRQAAFEKEASGKSPEDCLRQLAAAKKPVALIWGAEDQSSTEAEQIAPIREALKLLTERKLEGAGHAIPWTHPKELAEFVSEFLSALKV